jgi:hypothetical protein
MRCVLLPRLKDSIFKIWFKIWVPKTKGLGGVGRCILIVHRIRRWMWCFDMGMRCCGWVSGRGVGNWWENALRGFRLVGTNHRVKVREVILID